MIVEDDSLVVVVECAKRALIYCLYASHDLPSEVDHSALPHYRVSFNTNSIK